MKTKKKFEDFFFCAFNEWERKKEKEDERRAKEESVTWKVWLWTEFAELWVRVVDVGVRKSVDCFDFECGAWSTGLNFGRFSVGSAVPSRTHSECGPRVWGFSAFEEEEKVAVERQKVRGRQNTRQNAKASGHALNERVIETLGEQKKCKHVRVNWISGAWLGRTV